MQMSDGTTSNPPPWSFVWPTGGLAVRAAHPLGEPWSSSGCQGGGPTCALWGGAQAGGRGRRRWGREGEGRLNIRPERETVGEGDQRGRRRRFCLGDGRGPGRPSRQRALHVGKAPGCVRPWKQQSGRRKAGGLPGWVARPARSPLRPAERAAGGGLWSASKAARLPPSSSSAAPSVGELGPGAAATARQGGLPPPLRLAAPLPWQPSRALLCPAAAPALLARRCLSRGRCARGRVSGRAGWASLAPDRSLAPPPSFLGVVVVVVFPARPPASPSFARCQPSPRRSGARAAHCGAQLQPRWPRP